MPVALSADEKRWQAEHDARTLAEAEQIKQDEKRLADAQTAAKRMADEEAEKAKAMRKVAGRKGSPAGQSRSGEKKKSKQVKVTTEKNGSGTFNVFNRI